MPNESKFFKKKNIPKKIFLGGPSAEDQLLAMASNQYWIVLNTHLLKTCAKGTMLCSRVNAFKHSLQTYGPVSSALPDLREGKGLAKGFIFHGHVNDDDGTTYELEWTVIDNKKRIMALIGFGTHENYNFRSKPLNKDERNKILTAPHNVKICQNVVKKIEEAKKKVARMEEKYRSCSASTEPSERTPPNMQHKN